MATLKDTIRADLTAAMKARDAVTVDTLRIALTAITNAEVAGNRHVELDDTQTQAVLGSEAKKRAEAAEIFEQAGRADRAAAERAEEAVLRAYLPEALSDDELNSIVAEEVARAADAGHNGPRATGAVIGAVRARVAGRAEGARIAAAVKTAL